MSILKHRNGRSKPDDLESGPSTPTSPTHKDEAPYEGEEYDVLLRYARDQAALAGKGDDDDDDEDDGQRKRLWYAPWKTVTVKSEKEKKVRISFVFPCLELKCCDPQIPDDWLQTDMTQGLADSDVDTRRKQFGFNELQRFVDPAISIRAR